MTTPAAGPPEAVVDLANDSRYFSYLADAPNPPKIVPGDARLSLAEVPDATAAMMS